MLTQTVPNTGGAGLSHASTGGVAGVLPLKALCCAETKGAGHLQYLHDHLPWGPQALPFQVLALVRLNPGEGDRHVSEILCERM